MESDHSPDSQAGTPASTGEVSQGPVSGAAAGTPQGRPARSAGRNVLLGCLVTAVGGVTLLVLVAGGVFILFVASVFMTVSQEGLGVSRVPLQELTIEGVRGDPKIAEIPLHGLLVSGGAAGIQIDSVTFLKAMLEKAQEDPKIAGVLLSVDSGGGAVTACDVMSHALRQFRNKKAVPVVALLGDIAASGGYYVACGADYVMAHPTTMTGSIGVLMPLYSASDLMRKVGVEDRTVKSGDFKDMASFTAFKTPEQWQMEQDILRGLIMEMHERFVGVVAQGRDMDLETVRALADGRIYSSEQALGNGLVDGVGYWDDAVAKVMSMAGLEESHVVRYRRVPSLLEQVFARQKGTIVSLSPTAPLPLELQQRPMYLWRPPAPNVAR